MTDQQYRTAERIAAIAEAAILTCIALAIALAIVIVNHLP